MNKKPLLWVNVAFFTLTALGALTLVPWYGLTSGYSGELWAIFIAAMFFSGMSITAGYHRLWAHKAYKAHPVVQFIFALGGAFALQNSALHWSSDHRRHHGHVDHPDKDPYAATRGFWYSHIGWMLRDYQGDQYNNYNNAKDLKANAIVMWQHKHYLLLVLAMNVLVPAAIGWLLGDVVGALLLIGLLRLVLSQHFTFLINSLAHIWGKRPYTEKNTARDNALLALLTYGEGYHNFHHIFATDYRNGIRWFHYDPTKWLISALNACGLASDLKRTPQERIERAKAQVLLLQSEQKMARLPKAEEQLAKLHEEYDALLQQLNAFYKAKKQLLEAKKSTMLKTYEKSALKQQLKELEHAWQEQKRQWLSFNKQLLHSA